eukprot:g2447.t1
MATTFDRKPFSSQENEMIDLLLEIGQDHLFEAATINIEKTKKLLAQAKRLDQTYPNGLRAYVSSARKLLAQSRDGVNPYEGFQVKVPEGERLRVTDDDFHTFESLGMTEVKDTCFVLVAGGLGERLGYDGIKVELPIDCTTGDCYLKRYCEHILALQDRCNNAEVELPLFIMTSADTHDKTVSLLERNNYFGLKQGQVTLEQQEKVPAMVDNEGRFQINDEKDGIVTKPHGHGDVHMVLQQSGVAQKWRSEGRKWVVFFQDTNGLVFHGVVAGLGVSKKRNLSMNSVVVTRKVGEAVGGIVTLEKEERQLTLNVEYNQLGRLLGDKGEGKEGENSPFPGNINVLIFQLDGYAEKLKETGGVIAEFVNPKYKDEMKQEFKKACRIECMMQDYAKLLENGEKVGFTELERWVTFSAVKNNIVDGAAKYAKTGVAETAATGEADEYRYWRKILRHFGVTIEEEGMEKVEYTEGIPGPNGARIVIKPNCGTTIKEVKEMFPKPELVKISNRSSLVIENKVIFEGGLELDGDLWISEGGKTLQQRLVVRNKGSKLVRVGEEEEEEKFRIRGYKVKVEERKRI